MWRLAEGGALRVVPSAIYHPTLPGYHPQVGRSWKEEGFELLALPELRGVIEAVLAQLGDGDGGGLELLKPFKMAHVSPRVFWNLVKHCGGDVRAGLQQLLPNTDWAFLDERKRARSGKAVANIRQAARTYGCSLHRIRLQPPSHTVAASISYGCSLSHIRLQPLPPMPRPWPPPNTGQAAEEAPP